ncbi:MAG: hypothetical protein IPM52_01020 [Bacteroidetes bacterium]|nr:hypothetical protein [Bacteroidota bacterium]
MNLNQPKETLKKRKRVLIYLIFLSISAFFWLLIKLNNVYTLKIPVRLVLTDPPPGLWLEDESREQTIETEVQSTGFVLLRLSLQFKKSPELPASLQSLNPRKTNQNEYYLTAQALKTFIAANLNLSPEEVIITENQLNFKASTLESKLIPVVPNLEMSFELRFGPYGKPMVAPSEVEVFAIRQVLDTLTALPTKKASYKNVRDDIADSLDLVFSHPSMRAFVSKVFVFQDVEEFTETSFSVEIEPMAELGLRLFPNRIKLIVNVALKDFNQISQNNFQVEVDTAGLARRSPQLFLRVSNLPDNVQLVRMEPEKVEYLIPAMR